MTTATTTTTKIPSLRNRPSTDHRIQYYKISKVILIKTETNILQPPILKILVQKPDQNENDPQWSLSNTHNLGWPNSISYNGKT